jgi:hypothetical protein
VPVVVLALKNLDVSVQNAHRSLTPPINDPLTNAVQRSVHNRPVTWRLPALSPLSRIRQLGATE